MKNLFLSTSISLLFATSAFAAGSHGGGHGEDHAAMMEIGLPGTAANVTRTIDVTMRETDEGMAFEPKSFDIEQGETIRFNVKNAGEIEHEFVIDTMDGNAEHREMMAKMEMEHDDPNSVRLDAGKEGEVIWTFANAGTFEFACLIPGHYQSGMYGPITVSEKLAEAPVEYSTGKVKKVDSKGGKVTIIHGPLVNLDMPSMTMVFRADEDLIGKMKEGQNIDFVAERVKGKLTVVAMK
ncbi:copper-binding protein [Sulfitobacter aestuarii]|uniref:Copper-binding protein n=1 Tax=Sulfitobacter aestuarii TaxID=2161676 RepID=A0ABW5TX17_9RHOB